MANVSETIDIDFLGPIHEIIRSNDKDLPDQIQGSSSKSDTTRKIIAFQEKLNRVREQVATIPGADLPNDALREQIGVLQRQVILKRELLAKYKHGCPIEMPLKGFP